MHVYLCVVNIYKIQTYILAQIAVVWRSPDIHVTIFRHSISHQLIDTFDIIISSTFTSNKPPCIQPIPVPMHFIRRLCTKIDQEGWGLPAHLPENF